jgi:hypothetical protein
LSRSCGSASDPRSPWTWICEAYDQAFAKASDKDRTAALVLQERHLRERPY